MYSFIHSNTSGVHRAGYPPSVQIINLLKKKIRPLQTVLNGLKHEKNEQQNLPHYDHLPPSPPTHSVQIHGVMWTSRCPPT